jgi:hypothetical protein
VGNRTNRVQQTIQINDPAPAAGAIQSRRPYAQWGTIALGEWGGSAHYNALQAKLQSREWHGASLMAAYTYSKCMDNGTGEAGTITQSFVGPRNTGVCDFNLTHNLSFSYVYALPVGHGRTFMHSIPRWSDAVIGGWDVSGIVTVHSGLPFTPTISTDQANTGVGSQRAQVVGRPTLLGNPSCWFYISANPACVALDPGAANAFVLPTQYTYGNGGRNILRADGLIQWDFTLMKRFVFREARALEFRGEFFNILNHPTFSAPSTGINVSSGAQVGSTLNTARTVELAVKIFF